MKNKGITYRMAYRDEWKEAMGLAWKVFMKFDAPDYSDKGIESFREFVEDNGLYRMFIVGSYQLFVAIDGDRIIGILSLRNETHISLLFVDEEYQRRGVASDLIEVAGDYVMRELGGQFLTVNASPYGVVFYHNRGFRDLGDEEETDGIRYTPMVLYL